MNRALGKKIFAIVYVVLFVGGIHLINGWRLDWATFSSIPIVLSAETIVLGMLYMSIFYGEDPNEHTTQKSALNRPTQPAQIHPLADKHRAA